MEIKNSDWTLLRLATTASFVWKALGDVGTMVYSGRLEDVQVRRPVFITGLARAGTTITLNILSRTPGVATHRYRDFPFLMAPMFWSSVVDGFSKDEAPVERPHGDRIRITKESPEAFEEPLWTYFFPHVHEWGRDHRLTRETRHEEFDRFFTEHLSKIIALRGGERYISKGNYNVARIEYLGRLFPDAHFIIVIRHPYTHVPSLVAQHRKFCSFAKKDARVPDYLRAVGHFEFGPQRVPVLLGEGGERIRAAWESGEDARGYAIQWKMVYRHVHELVGTPGLEGRISVLRYEDFCSRTAEELRRVAKGAGLEDKLTAEQLASDVSPPPDKPLDEATRAAIWQEAGAMAGEFGYREDGRA